MNKKDISKAIIISLILSFVFAFTNNNAAHAAKMTYNDCITKAASKLKTTEDSIKELDSVRRACENIAGRESWQGAIWLSNKNSNTYGENPVDRKTELSGESVKTYLHGIILFNGDSNKQLQLPHTYAIQIGFYYCSNYAAGSDACENKVKIPAGNTSKYIKYTGPHDYKQISLDGSNANTGLTLDRGKKESGSYLSNGGYNVITFYPNNIIDYLKSKGKITNSTKSFKLYIYRRGLLSYDNTGIIEDGSYDEYTAGYDAESFTIKTQDIKETVTMKTGTKVTNKETAYNYKNKKRTVEISGTGDEIKVTVYFAHVTTSNKNPTSVTMTTDGSDEEEKKTHTLLKESTTDDGRYYRIYKVILKLGYEESKKVCESATFKPKTYVNDKSKGDSDTTEQTCVTVKRTDVKKTVTDSGRGKVEHKATDFSVQGLNDAIVENGAYTFASDYTSQIRIAFGTTLSIDNRLPQNVKEALSAENITEHETIKYSYSGTGVSNTTGTSGGGNKTINIPRFTLSPGESKEICAELKIDPSQYYYEFSSSETIINGTSQGKKYTITPYESESVTRTKCVTVYRKTEINTTTNIQLKTSWKTSGTTNSINQTTSSNNTDNILEHIYAPSLNEKDITLKYTHTLNYAWQTGTFSNRITNYNKIGWWSKIRENIWKTYSTIANQSSASDTKNNSQKITNKEGSPANTNESDTITLGSFQEYCRSTVAPATYEAGYQSDPTVKGTNESKAEICAYVYRPWNYKLSFASISTAGVNNGQVILNDNATGYIDVNIKINNENNYNSDPTKGDPNQVGNASYSPETKITLYEFTVAGNSAISASQVIDDYHNKISQGRRSTIITPVKIDTKTKTFEPKSTNTEKFQNVSVSGSTGSHVCFYATINYTNSTNDTANTYYGTPTQHTTYSEPTCFTVTSIPTTQIRGGSLYAEGNVMAKVYNANGLLGSWVDYGLISNGTVSEFASGKAISKTGRYNAGTNENHPLTVANYDNDRKEVLNPKGTADISSPTTKNRIVSLYSNPTNITTLSEDVDISTSYTTYTSNQYTTKTGDTPDPSAKYRYTKVAGGKKITQNSALGAGITHVIYSEGSITIGSDLKYVDENYTSISEIPQFIIIAKGDINIEKSVTEINAWLIADGEINTCAAPNLHQTNTVYYSEICDNALTVNGPVFAKNILLERTGNGTDGNGKVIVSEVFNITAANYYWAFAKAKENGKTSIVYTRSLAPRY